MCCVLNSMRTTQKEKNRYLFDECYKCSIRVLVQRSCLLSTKPMCFFFSGNEELVDVDIERWMYLKTSHIVLFKSNHKDDEV